MSPPASVRAMIAALLFALLSACGSAPRRDLDHERLDANLAALGQDSTLAGRARAERALAQVALRALDSAGPRARDHGHLAYIAERRVEIAYAAAQAEVEAGRLAELRREHAEILLRASRRDAELTRDELDRQRTAELARREQEDRERAAGTQATQAPPPVPPAATEAPAASANAPTTTATGVDARTLHAVRGSRGMQITLEDAWFASGRAELAIDSVAELDPLVAFVASSPLRPILIEGHTDSTGSAPANQALSQRRAEAVRDALVARGVAPARISVAGIGEVAPIATNDDAPGRARNRRVDVILVER